MKNRTAIILLSTVGLAIVGAWLLVVIVGEPFAADPLHKGTTPEEGVTQAFAASIRPVAAHMVNWIYCFIVLLVGYSAVLGLVIFPRNLKARCTQLGRWKTIFDEAWKEEFEPVIHRRGRSAIDEEEEPYDSDRPQHPRVPVQSFVERVLGKFAGEAGHPQDFSQVITDGLKRYNPDEGPDILYHSLASQKEELHESLEEELAPIEVALHLSPLLGFLGTVISLVKLFYNVSISVEGMNQQAVAQDLQEALITTVFGLVSAFLIHLIRLYDSSQLVGYMDELRRASQRIVEMVQGAIEEAEEVATQWAHRVI